MNPETKFRKRITPQIDALPNAFGFSIQQLAIVGTPDKIYCINGWLVAIEIKKDEKAKRSPMQIYNLNRINKAGGFGLIVYPENWQDVFSFLELLSSDKGKAYAHDDLRSIKRSLVLSSYTKSRARDDNQEP